MDDQIIELLYRNLQEVFGEGDVARRRAAIEDFYTEDCVLYVPPGVFVGYDALDKFAGDLRATHPYFVYTPLGEAQALHNAGILAWGSGPKGEAPQRLRKRLEHAVCERIHDRFVHVAHCSIDHRVDSALCRAVRNAISPSRRWGRRSGSSRRHRHARGCLSRAERCRTRCMSRVYLTRP